MHPRRFGRAVSVAVVLFVGSSSAVASPVHAPQSITARRMAARAGASLKPGTGVNGLAVFSRSFADAKHAFGLAGVDNATYPARSSDGGASWFTDGPALHIDALDAPEAVEYTGVVGDSTEFAYGSSAVDVTTDGGREWWEALLGEAVLAVTFENHELIAFVQQQTTHDATRAVTWVYVSNDGGRQWRYNDNIGAFTAS